MPPEGATVRGIDHVGLVVRSLDAAVQFYVEELGMTVEGDRVELEGRDTAVQFLQAGTGKVELLAPTTDTGPLSRFLDKRGEGLHHVCYELADIHGAVRRLTDRGVRMVDAEPWRSPHGWVAYLHPAAAHGCAIELREHYR
ncbi:VOC family protein [Micromonospora sp. FIMYZ51]|uniref:VOC family protein n=1 Tax=Micromonospora sp. FIMYZ51 TaxID=3051832 RepID=UPI00311E864B